MGFIPANNLHPSGFYKRIFYLQYTLSFLLVPCAFMMGNTLKKTSKTSDNETEPTSIND